MRWGPTVSFQMMMVDIRSEMWVNILRLLKMGVEWRVDIIKLCWTGRVSGYVSLLYVTLSWNASTGHNSVHRVKVYAGMHVCVWVHERRRCYLKSSEFIPRPSRGIVLKDGQIHCVTQTGLPFWVSQSFVLGRTSCHISGAIVTAWEQKWIANFCSQELGWIIVRRSDDSCIWISIRIGTRVETRLVGIE